MSDPVNLEGLSIQELIELKERVTKTLDTKIAHERAELERRQSDLAKLTERASGGKPGKPAKPAKAKPAAPRAPAVEDAAKAAASVADEATQPDGGEA